MPVGEWFIQDRGGERCIYAGAGLDPDTFMALYRKGGVYGRVLAEGSHRLVSKNLPVVNSLEQARLDLWYWVKGQQCPMMVVHQGRLPKGHCCPRIEEKE
jgi:hypothetical protein